MANILIANASQQGHFMNDNSTETHLRSRHELPFSVKTLLIRSLLQGENS